MIFNHTIRPMLHTVRMHPLLVTHSRDQEKTPARWKKLEVHEVVVEAGRYALVQQEAGSEDNSVPFINPATGRATFLYCIWPGLR